MRRKTSTEAWPRALRPANYKEPRGLSSPGLLWSEWRDSNSRPCRAGDGRAVRRMAPLAPGCAGTARGCRGGRGSFVSRIIRSPGDCRPRDSFGPSGETRTRGLLLPKQAPYQLGYTRSQKNLGLFPRCDTQLIIADSVPGGKRNKSACRTKAGPGGTGPPGPGACKIGAIMI